MEVKKNPRADLNRNSIIYFQIGIILVLFLIHFGLELNFREKAFILQPVAVETENLEDIPITELKEVPPIPLPPPPPAPEYIEVVEDKSDIEESLIASTETSQDEMIEIPEVSDIKEEKEPVPEEIVYVPFVVIEKAPIYPGCENANGREAQKKCMSSKIDDLVKQEFRTDLGAELGLYGLNRIIVVFRIDENGYVADIRARGPHKRLEAEAERVIKMLPKMEPGRQRNRPVGVVYSLPIAFKIED